MLSRSFSSFGSLACLALAFGSSVALPLHGQNSVPAQSKVQQLPESDPRTKLERTIEESFDKLSEDDRKLAVAQRHCAVKDRNRLGSMGTPIKLIIDGQPVFLCCEGCRTEAMKDQKKTLAMQKKIVTVSATLAKLDPTDRAQIEKQKYCAVMERSLLGSMGEPIKLVINGQTVYVCCKSCIAKANSNPGTTIANFKKLVESK